MGTRRNGRRNGNGNGSVFNAGTIVNVFSIPIITTGFVFIGWYFTTNATMAQYNKDIVTLQTNREGDRKEFGTKFDDMNKALASLDKHAAVQDETLKEIRDALRPSVTTK